MNQLKEFVIDYFKANNAKVLESKKQITIQVPKRLCTKLNCEEVLNITFNKETAENNPDINFIAAGSALLDKILESCEKRGLTVVKQFKGKNKFEGLEFNFKVIFESVDKKEKLVSYLIDLDNQKINNELLKKLEKKDFEERDKITLNSQIVEKCFNTCFVALKNSIKPDIDRINNKLNNASENEKKIIEKFYDGIISDLRKKQEEKIRIWKEKKEKAHSSSYVEIREKYRKEVDKSEESILEIQEKNFEELNNYFHTKEKRLKEIENQYQLKTKLLLYGAALVSVK